MTVYLEHFGLNEAPFRITPHTQFFFAGGNRGATLDALVYAIVHDEGIVKVSGEVGSGKTMLCRVLMERLPGNVAIVYLANPSLSRDDIVFAIADDLELSIPDNLRSSAALRALQSHLIELHARGQQVVVLIDEAHAVPVETLEQIRLLSNLETSQHKLLQLVLFGQPELDEVLARPDMRQLRERITQQFFLQPLRQDDIAHYIDFRMRLAGYRGPTVFNESAIRLISGASLGLTRRVNILAEKSLLAAFAQGKHAVTPNEVKAAIRDARYAPPTRRLQMGLAATATIAAAVVLATTWNPSSHEVVDANTAPIAATAQTPHDTAIEAATARNAVPPRLTFAESPKGDAAASLPPLSPEARERMAITRQWIEATDPRQWFIQLVATNSSQIEDVENYLVLADRLLSPEKAGLYVAGTPKAPRIGIIYGEFASIAAATAAIEKLPRELRVNSPFPRQVLWLK